MLAPTISFIVPQTSAFMTACRCQGEMSFGWLVMSFRVSVILGQYFGFWGP